MKFDIITAFPEAFSYLNASLLKRAQDKNLIAVKIWNLRDFASGADLRGLKTDSRRKLSASARAQSAFSPRLQIDDRPFGGGPGMVLKVEPIYSALQKITNSKLQTPNTKIILTDAGGKQFNQDLVKKLSKEKQLIIICGHYEGIDERVKKFADLKISVGPYILTGGELPAMIIVDAVSRYIKGFLQNPESLEEKRFFSNYLRMKSNTSRITNSRRIRHLREGFEKKSVSIPVYTRPEVFIDKKGRKLKVPKVLLSGDHKEIAQWRQKHAKIIS
jgi:tRNA (guanine37-N1)-methyltransferase